MHTRAPGGILNKVFEETYQEKDKDEKNIS